MKNIQIIKRNNQKEDYRPEKIAIVIKKGFDSVDNKNYSHLDIRFIYKKVREIVEEYTTISVEEIQDLIEKQLLKNNYIDVYESFFKYRLLRSESRHTFSQKHNVLLRSLNIINDNPNSLKQYNQILTQQYALQYRLSKDIRSLYNEGIIHIDNLEQLAYYYPNTITIDNYSNHTQLLLKIQSIINNYHSNIIIDTQNISINKDDLLYEFINNFPQKIYIKDTLKNYLQTDNNLNIPTIINSIFTINLRRIKNQNHFEEILQSIDNQLILINKNITIPKNYKQSKATSIINLAFKNSFQIITTQNLITAFNHPKAIDYFNQIDSILDHNL